jgi:hypothetical protein
MSDDGLGVVRGCVIGVLAETLAVIIILLILHLTGVL